MTRYRYNSRLFKDSLEKKEHFKMYKKGKLWLVAGISVFTSGLSYTMLASHEIHADTTATTTSSSQNTATTTTAQAGGSGYGDGNQAGNRNTKQFRNHADPDGHNNAV